MIVHSLEVFDMHQVLAVEQSITLIVNLYASLY